MKMVEESTQHNQITQAFSEVALEHLVNIAAAEYSKMPSSVEFGTDEHDNHGKYRTNVKKLQQIAVATYVSSHPNHSEVMDTLARLQRNYAKVVRDAVLGGKQKLTDEIEMYKGLVEEQKPTIDKYDAKEAKLAELLKAGKTQNFKLMAELSKLGAEVQKSKENEEKLRQYESSLNNLEQAANALDTLIKSGNNQIRHYTIDKPEDIIKSLGEQGYWRPKFKPFTILPEEVNDIFAEEQVYTTQKASSQNGSWSVKINSLPKIFKDYLMIRKNILNKSLGTQIESAPFLEMLEPLVDIGPKALTTHLKRFQADYGLKHEQVGQKHFFTRIGGTVPADDLTFVSLMYDSMTATQKSEVNFHYIEKSLWKMRDQAKPYDGFTIDTIAENVKAIGFPINLKSVSRQVNNRLDDGIYRIGQHELEIRPDSVDKHNRSKDKLYFRNIFLTHSQKAVAGGLGEFGYDPIRIIDLIAYARTKHDYNLHETVAEHILDNIGPEYGIERTKDKEPTWKKTGNPETAASLEQQTQPDNNLANLV